MSGSLGDVNPQIEGGTDGTIIGNVSDALKVNIASVGSALPTIISVPVVSLLLNGSSPDMNVNGSVTPVNFTYSAPTSQTIYLNKIGILLLDGGTMDPTDFGSRSALTNGVALKIRTDGTEYTISTVKNNLELIGAYQKSSNFMNVDTAAFLNSNDIFFGSVDLFQPVILKNSTSDYVRITISDNLTGIDHFKGFIQGWRAI